MQPITDGTIIITKNRAGLEAWAGTYIVHQLSARDYLQLIDDCVLYYRNQPNWNGEIADSEMKLRIVAASVTKDGHVLTTEIPSKLYEILASKALPVNTVSRQEHESLFLDSSTINQQSTEA